jgi:hypothetical protein
MPDLWLAVSVNSLHWISRLKIPVFLRGRPGQVPGPPPLVGIRTDGEQTRVANTIAKSEACMRTRFSFSLLDTGRLPHRLG